MMGRIGSARVPLLGSLPYQGYALALDFKKGIYRTPSGLVSSISSAPGYSYTRSGAKSEVRSTDGAIFPFAASVPGIVPGDGYWSRAAMTNLILQSQAFDNASWTKINATITANSTTAPDGTLTADTITTSGAAAQQRVVQSNSPSGLQTFSVFFKSGSVAYVQLAFNADATMFANFDLSLGVVGTVGAGASASMVSLPGGWYRCIITITAAGTSSWNIYIVPAANSAYGVNFTATVATLPAWQAQLVAGSQPGPIILTTGSTATVGADALSFTGLSIPPPYTLILEAKSQSVAFNNIDFIGLNTFADGAGLGAGTDPSAWVREASATTAQIASVDHPAASRIRMAARFSTNGTAISAGGSAVGKDTSNNPPTIGTLFVGRGITFFGSYPNAPLSFFGIVPRAYSDAELIAESGK